MIRELTTANFHEYIQQSEYAVIDFYGDFCFACELLEPVFDGTARKMPGISFGRINTTENMEIAEELSVFDLPTLHFYHNGELVTSASGSMDEEMLLSFMGELLYGREE